jgi:hypothetical protein
MIYLVELLEEILVGYGITCSCGSLCMGTCTHARLIQTMDELHGKTVLLLEGANNQPPKELPGLDLLTPGVVMAINQALTRGMGSFTESQWQRALSWAGQAEQGAALLDLIEAGRLNLSVEEQDGDLLLRVLIPASEKK